MRVLKVVLVLVLVLVLDPLAHARRDRTVSGDLIKAARFLQTARLDDARAVLSDLEKRAPDTIEVKWLDAALAFQSGEYARAVKVLDKVPDDSVDGMAGQTKKRAQQSLAIT